MTISNNGFDCEEMWGVPCNPELQAVRDGGACYECKTCGALTFGPWPFEDYEPPPIVKPPL